MKIGFVGLGNMGGAIAKGFAQFGLKKEDKVFLFDHDQEKMKDFFQEFDEFNITICDSLGQLIWESGIIILGVKPNVYEDVLPEVSRNYTDDKIIVSMAAGIAIAHIEKYLGDKSMVVRIMPNTPALVGESMTAICRNDNVSDNGLKTVMEILEGVGKVELVEERLFHQIIGTSGSSPAYTYMYIEALAEAATAAGLEAEKSRIFAAQSVLGAAKMVLEKDLPLEQLRENVCSKGGTTIEAVKTLEEIGFQEDVIKGWTAAVERSKEMEK